MKSHARVVVIGGGVVGVSTLYHLTKKGWSDVVLLERTELTAGSTWHAAGLLPLFNMSYAVGKIHKYSVDLYKRLQEETGQDVSFHVTGNLRLAQTKERMDEYLNYCGTANTIGVPFQMITPEEIKKLWPLINIDGIIGALYHPDDGHIAPVDVTNAMAIGAKNNGGTIYRQTEVLSIEQQPNDEWLIRTNKGDITAEHVVSCTGNYARQTAAMVGLDIPVIPVEHQYIITDEVPELVARKKAGLPELAVLRESDESYYLREERQGYILGPYEKGAPACFVDGVPETFGQDLFPGDLERLMPHVEAVIKRVPSFEHAGIKDIVNGPIAYTPDGSPMIGPAWGLKNFWMNEGHSFGVTAAGGSGWQLAEWITEGEPSIDMMDVDPRRFGAYATKPYTKLKNEECYEHVFVVHYPDEERSVGRPLKQSPCHDRMASRGAVFGQRYGWERPNWFAPEGVDGTDDWSFRRSNYFEHVGNEAINMRTNAGLIDITSFSKFQVTGPGAEAYLDRLVCRKLPKASGRIHLSHALSKSGGIRSEFTIMKDAPGSYYLVSSGAAERFDFDYLEKNLPKDGSVRLDNVTTQHGVLVLAGPRARDILSKVTDADLSNEAFKWLTGQHITVGLAPCRALRVNFVGDLGWELHHPIEYQNHIYDALVEAGEEFGLKMCGMRAMDSLRMEKNYRMWGQDLTREYSVFEAGLDRFVHLDKGDFIGRDALVKQKEEGVAIQFVALEIFGIKDADALGNEPLRDKSGNMVGRATAGAYGHFTKRSLAQGYIDTASSAVGTPLTITILGEDYDAVVIEESVYDPENIALRS
ncbi:MAG: FAD-dependent oxidoreductase [Pseudomonas marincola]